MRYKDIGKSYKDLEEENERLWHYHVKNPQLSVNKLARIFHMHKSTASRKLAKKRKEKGISLKGRRINSWMK